MVALFAILLGVDLAAAKPVPKEVAEALRLKFGKGRVYFLEVKTSTVQKMMVMQQNVNQNQEQTMVIQVAPAAQVPGGDWQVDMSIVGMRLKMDIGGNNIDFDSSNPMPGSPLAPFYEALCKSKFTAIVAANGELKKLDGRDEVIKGLNNLPAGTDALVKGMLSEAAMKKMFMPIGEFLPDRVERVGAHWQRQWHVEFGPVGKYVYENRYTYHEGSGKIHEIRATTSMKYQPPEKNDGALPFAIKEVKVTKSDGKGVYKFDAERGRLAESTHESEFKATMKIGVGGMDTDVELDQVQKTIVRALESNPLK
jgi:Family of unknown function (DUF6263)